MPVKNTPPSFIFNSNNIVLVKLTPEGVKRHRTNYFTKGIDLAAEYEPPQLDDNGYWHVQLWQLMENFGEYMFNTGVNYFDMDILIPKRGLVDWVAGSK